MKRYNATTLLLFGAIVWCLVDVNQSALDTDFEDSMYTGNVLNLSDVDIFGLERSRRNSVKDPSLKWPKGEVPFVFHSNMGADGTGLKRHVTLAMREIEDNTKKGDTYCVRFIPKTASHYSYLKIGASGQCDAHVGKQPKISVLVMGRDCNSISGVMALLLRSLGFVYEINRFDRNRYVEIQWDNIEKKNYHLFASFNSSQVNNYVYGYDFKSILQPPSYYWGMDPRKPTIKSKFNQRQVRQGAPDWEIARNLYMDRTDVLRVQRFYGCPLDPSHLKRPTRQRFLDRCNFDGDQGLCSFKQEKTKDNFDWQIGSGSTPTHGTGPAGDANNPDGSGKYLYVEANGHLNQVARLNGRRYDHGSYCVGLRVFHNGTDTGTFKLYMSSGTFEQHVKGLTFPVDDRWTLYEAELTIPNHTRSWFLIFEYTVGSAESSDFAIDDFSIRKGKCINR